MTFRWILALAAALLLAACGGNTTDRTKAQLRLVNASDGYAVLDLRVEDELRLGDVAYGTRADYVEVDPGKAASTITRSGSATALLSFTPAMDRDKHYTVLAYGAEDRFAAAHHLMAAALPAGAALCLPGKHDWACWRALWLRLLELGSLA